MKLPAFITMKSARRLAFSLIELLVVVAIGSVMMALLIPAFGSLGKSQILNAEGNKIVNLINLAGQNSASKNAMTALVAVPGDSTRPGSFALFEVVPETTAWKQISKWESLKDGIVAEYPNPAFSFTEYPAVKPDPDFPAMTLHNAAITSFKYLVFLPSRSLFQNNSAQLRLVEGFYPAGSSSATYTRPGTNAGVANHYTVTVLGTTGRPKIDRP